MHVALQCLIYKPLCMTLNCVFPGYIEGLLEEVWKGIFCEVQCMCSALLLFKVLYSFHLKTVLS